MGKYSAINQQQQKKSSGIVGGFLKKKKDKTLFLFPHQTTALDLVLLPLVLLSSGE